MQILITNITLGTRTGTELYVRDLATALLDRGHTPIVYTMELGPVAQELRAASVTVVDELDALAALPDLIHGHHNVPTMKALLRFPRVPAVFVCHDARSWHDSPPRAPSIFQYVAVDLDCRNRLSLMRGIPEDRIRLLLNFVDLKRFAPRGPLPPYPARALVFSNYASKHTHLGAVREACARAGIALDVIGARAGKVCAKPEEVLQRYDLVFAKGRCALEAGAVGAAVVLCDAAGAGPMVTAAEVDRLRPLGIRALSQRIEPGTLLQEIARYDPKDAAEVSRRIRATAGLEAAVDQLTLLYQEAIADYRSQRDYESEARWRARAHLNVLGWQPLTLAWRLRRRFLKWYHCVTANP